MVIGMTMNDEYFLANDKSDPRINGQEFWCWTYPSDEYGTGNKTFLFEGMGTCKQPAVCDIIHADSTDDARMIVREKYKERLNWKTLIPRTEDLVVEVSDIR